MVKFVVISLLLSFIATINASDSDGNLHASKQDAFSMLNSRVRRGRWEEEFVFKSYSVHEVYNYVKQECQKNYRNVCSYEEWDECNRLIKYNYCDHARAELTDENNGAWSRG